MPLHIGIAACSAEGAALCYRTICTEAPLLLGAAHAHPEVSMHTPDLARTMDLIYRGDWDGVGEVMLDSARKLASIGVHISRWVTTHGYALNVDLDPAPFTDWITACGLEDAAFTTLARELGRPLKVDEVRPLARAALAEVFDLELSDLPAEDGAGLWPQTRHVQLATR